MIVSRFIFRSRILVSLFYSDVLFVYFCTSALPILYIRVPNKPSQYAYIFNIKKTLTISAPCKFSTIH